MVPGLIAAHAMQTAVGETTYPVMGMIKWQRIYDSMLATPLQLRHLVAAHLALRRVPAGDDLRRLHAGAGAVRRLRVVVGAARWRSRPRSWSGWRSRPWSTGSPPGSTPRRRSACCSGSASSRSSCSRGAFFPVGNLGDVGAWVARLTPLWHGVNLSRMFALDEVTWWVAGVNVAVLVVLALGRLALVGLRPEKRLIS